MGGQVHNLATPESLLATSERTLGELELASLARASNLGKAIREEMFLWAEEYAKAMVARWVRDNRERLIAAARKGPEDADRLFDSLIGRE
jgi:hypothetical protein